MLAIKKGWHVRFTLTAISILIVWIVFKDEGAETDIKIGAIFAALIMASALPIFAYNLLFRAPNEMWSSAQQEMDVLRDKIAPKLEIVFGKSPPYMQLDEVPQGTLFSFRIGVRNLSKIETIKNVHVHLEDIKNYDTAFTHVLMQPMYGSPTFDLSPEETKHINIAQWRSTYTVGKRAKLSQRYLDERKRKHPPWDTFGIGGIHYDSSGDEIISKIVLCYAEELPNQIPFDGYVLVIGVYADGISSLTKRISLIATENWELVFEPAD